MGYERHPGIDLHIHSSASDGTFTPREILTQAGRLGLAAISITDHDTVDGCRQVMALPTPAGVQCLTGIEISSQPPEGFGLAGSLHILGYGIDPSDPHLIRAISPLQEARQQRLPKMIGRLNHLGFKISEEEVREVVGRGQPGRPHLARAMMKKGVVNSIDEAFDRYLGNGQPAYVQKYRLPYRQAIETILRAGGIAVLAHPGLLELPAEADLALLQRLKRAGLGGIEAYYPRHSAEAAARYRRLAQKLALLITGGTDFHGDITPDIQLGSARGGFSVPYEIYRALAARLASRSPMDTP